MAIKKGGNREIYLKEKEGVVELTGGLLSFPLRNQVVSSLV
jgi:hypothetical protein